MEKVLKDLERIVPEALGMIRTRYHIMREIYNCQPIGRRQIALRIGSTERMVRSEIEVLKEKGAAENTPAGIVLTDFGAELFHSLEQIIPHIKGLTPLALALKEMFGLDQVVVVPGDSFTDAFAKKDLGRAAARYVKEILRSGDTLAVTGGTTLAEMARAMNSGTYAEEVTVLPARGGLGEEIEEQANAIAAHIAKAIKGYYRLLHVPDNLEKESIELLLNNPQIADIVHSLKTSDVVVHGIGSAIEMACRRGLGEDALHILEDQKAVGEVFRYYFNQEGKIVYRAAGIGLELEDLNNIPTIIAVAGGSNKAQAIEAVLVNRRRGTLITDEGAARAILNRRYDLC